MNVCLGRAAPWPGLVASHPERPGLAGRDRRLEIGRQIGHRPFLVDTEMPMNTRLLVISTVVGGLVSTFLSNVPIINLVNCLLCAGFWAGPLLSVWLYRRQAGSLSLGQGVLIGTLAGVWAGLFGFALSLVGLAGAATLMRSYSQYLPSDAGIDVGSAGLSVLFNIVGVGFNILFGAIGGLIGGAIFKTGPNTPPAAV
jgi:hypothetical protein